MSKNRAIEVLRAFFKVSNAAFEFKNSIETPSSGRIEINKMHPLHKSALIEIEKENPDMLLIDRLLAEMEITERENKQKSEGLS